MTTLDRTLADFDRLGRFAHTKRWWTHGEIRAALVMLRGQALTFIGRAANEGIPS